jgi:hypothetical protein
MSDDLNIDQVIDTFLKPNWEKWNKTTRAKLWHAVALACNLDPKNFQIEGHSLVRLLSNRPVEFDDLLTMAKGSIGANGILKLLPPSGGSLEEREVKLSNFAAWLKSVPHTPPPEFPWQPESITLSNMDWPWGRYETRLLRKLASAADQFWTRYDPNFPDTSTDNKVVSAWLVEEGVSPHIAKAMATILRDERLPTRIKRVIGETN